MAKKILIGGSPCTFWSIAQKNNRETEASGMGWELFKNYLIAKEKFKPDFFLYENNKSASQAIKDQIAEEFGVGVDPDVRFTYINSALVSAQNRQRFYVTNFGDIEQPEDRGILLKDILETGDTDREKGLAVKSTMACEAVDSKATLKYLLKNLKKHDDKSGTITASCYKGVGTDGMMTIAEPVRIPEYGNDEKARPINAYYSNNCGGFEHRMFSDNPNKQQVDMIAEPLRVGALPRPNGELSTSQSMRVYSTDGKSVNLTSGGGGVGAKTGLYAVPVKVEDADNGDEPVLWQYPHGYNPGGAKYKKAPTLTANGSWVNNNLCVDRVNQVFATPCEWNETGEPTKAISCADGKTYTVYEVKDGQITIKGKQYPIKLADGYYIIRKLTVTECARLQTMPDDYCKAVSDTQAYKALGNGWTAEVIIHLLNHALKDVPRDEEIIVLSLYDGIATGRYCLDKMGFTNVTYHAYEIDKYPIMVAMDNYPDIIQHGDAFAVREDDWKPPQTRSEWLDELLGGA